MNYLIYLLMTGLAFFGGHWLTKNSDVQPYVYDNGGSGYLSFGATDFPTSLDSLTNPTATDSVATVSHSGQHSNANDALEAIEAKVGIGSATPVANTLFSSVATGISGWFTWATTTRLTATNFFGTASSTISNLTSVTSTSTNATSTNSFATNASSTNLYSSSFIGAGLGAPCETTNALTWNGGTFGCVEISTSGPTVFSTTTSIGMATTSLKTSDGSLPSSKSNYVITMVVASTTGSSLGSAEVTLIFNSDHTTKYSYNRLVNGSASVALNNSGVFLHTTGATYPLMYFKIDIANNIGAPKLGSWASYNVSTTTAHDSGQNIDGRFVWANTSDITQIDIGMSTANALFGTSTQIQVMGY